MTHLIQIHTNSISVHIHTVNFVRFYFVIDVTSVITEMLFSCIL